MRGQAATGERLEWSVLVFFSPYCPGVDHWRQKNSSTRSQSGTGAFCHPVGWRDREAPRKVKAFGGALVEWWVEAVSGELVGQEATSSPDHNSRDLLLWRTLSLPLPRLTIREDNGTPLQYSCLENPMDGGAWWAAVHGVTKSWTRLSVFNFTFHFYSLEKEMATHSSVLAWRIPGTGEPGGLLSMGSQRVGHDWSDLAAAAGLLWGAQARISKINKT